MTVRGPGLTISTTLYLHVGAECRTSVFAMPDRDKVVAHLDGDGTHTSLIVDRDGITLLEDLLSRARAELDTTQDEMAAAIDAEPLTDTERMTA